MSTISGFFGGGSSGAPKITANNVGGVTAGDPLVYLPDGTVSKVTNTTTEIDQRIDTLVSTAQSYAQGGGPVAFNTAGDLMLTLMSAANSNRVEVVAYTVNLATGALTFKNNVNLETVSYIKDYVADIKYDATNDCFYACYALNVDSDLEHVKIIADTTTGVVSATKGSTQVGTYTFGAGITPNPAGGFLLWGWNASTVYSWVVDLTGASPVLSDVKTFSTGVSTTSGGRFQPCYEPTNDVWLWTQRTSTTAYIRVYDRNTNTSPASATLSLPTQSLSVTGEVYYIGKNKFVCIYERCTGIIAFEYNISTGTYKAGSLTLTPLPFTYYDAGLRVVNSEVFELVGRGILSASTESPHNSVFIRVNDDCSTATLTSTIDSSTYSVGSTGDLPTYSEARGSWNSVHSHYTGTIFQIVARSKITPYTTLVEGPFIGIAETTETDGNPVKVATKGNTATMNIALNPAKDYYVDIDGSVVTLASVTDTTLAAYLGQSLDSSTLYVLSTTSFEDTTGKVWQPLGGAVTGTVNAGTGVLLSVQAPKGLYIKFTHITSADTTTIVSYLCVRIDGKDAIGAKAGPSNLAASTTQNVHNSSNLFWCVAPQGSAGSTTPYSTGGWSHEYLYVAPEQLCTIESTTQASSASFAYRYELGTFV